RHWISHRMVLDFTGFISITSLKKWYDHEFLDGTRHVVYPWNQSNIENRKSSSPRIYLAQVNPKSKI
ncbi:hypothetical protein, partial [Microcoleus sp. D2_18a_D3]|uniref:hypothetical protein n=1 Tax=Microcoleus sp. D2_18a_D3 TaxID=3055330 RepID=UPI002FD67C64